MGSSNSAEEEPETPEEKAERLLQEKIKQRFGQLRKVEQNLKEFQEKKFSELFINGCDIICTYISMEFNVIHFQTNF